MIVLKFGGTSVQNANWIDKAINITEKQLNKAPVLVSSAMGKTTDLIVEMTKLAEQGNLNECLTHIDTLKNKSYTDSLLFSQRRKSSGSGEPAE